MAVTAAQPNIQMRNQTGASIGDGVVLTGSVIYLHTLVARNATGKIQAAAANTTTRVVGLAVSAPGGNDFDDDGVITGDGTKRCTYIYNVEVLLPMTTATTQGLNGLNVYCTDNFQVQGTSPTGNPQVGVLAEYAAANSGWVRLTGGPITAAVGP